ncbi:MAG: carboxypeptidase M32 [Halobacteriaceae archaeon]
MDDDAPAPYRELLDRYDRVANLDATGELLSWDQQVTMPAGGTPARSRQLSAVSSAAHEYLVDDATGRLLDEAEAADLSDRQAAAVREIRRRYDRAASVPTSLVERVSEAASEALPTWRDARADDDFAAFAPALEELVELKREYAAHVDPEREPYEVLFEEYEPYLGLDTAERILAELRDGLGPLVDAVRASDVTLASPFDGTYPEADQEAACRALLDHLGYDWSRGRLDASDHPFSTGTPFDARVTTRYDESDPLEALTSVGHEFGHAAYTLGLPQADYGTPLGQARNLTVHESQSRFWENHVVGTEPFWEGFAPTLADELGAEAAPRAVYEAVNRVRPDNRIRVEADELTYHMHVVLRFEIERALIAGEMDVRDVPAAWNDKMDAYLGVRPETDAEGCLQDIHWSHGSFGYFPTYSLGSVLAAQLDASLRADLDVDRLAREGEFGALGEWLRERVHRHGRRYTTPDLVETATGESLTASHFLDHAERRYGALYGF